MHSESEEEEPGGARKSREEELSVPPKPCTGYTPYLYKSFQPPHASALCELEEERVTSARDGFLK